MAAFQEAFLKPVRTILAGDVYLRSQGPKVVEIELPTLGCPALMRRPPRRSIRSRGARIRG